MATIKSFTDIEKSRKLAEILPLESADAFYVMGEKPVDIAVIYGFVTHKHLQEQIAYKRAVPCWSLSALLNYLKSKNKFPEIKELSDGRFKLTTFIWDGKNSIQVSIADDLVDACYEIIIKLHELNLL